jgi:hypothetical protein
MLTAPENERSVEVVTSACINICEQDAVNEANTSDSSKLSHPAAGFTTNARLVVSIALNEDLAAYNLASLKER